MGSSSSISSGRTRKETCLSGLTLRCFKRTLCHHVQGSEWGTALPGEGGEWEGGAAVGLHGNVVERNLPEQNRLRRRYERLRWSRVDWLEPPRWTKPAVHVQGEGSQIDRVQRYVLIIHFYVESGRKLIQFKIRSKMKIFIFLKNAVSSTHNIG